MDKEEKVIEIRNRKYYSQYYVNQLQQENKKLKEVIDKAICYIQENTCWELRTSKLLDILKEVSK